jgi:hypothetical protein
MARQQNAIEMRGRRRARDGIREACPAKMASTSADAWFKDEIGRVHWSGQPRTTRGAVDVFAKLR